MKIINCPVNGPRNVQEFVFGGEVVEEPAPDASTNDWARHVFFEENRRGVVDEWWLHAPSSYWFIARRDRSCDDFIETFTVEQYFNAGQNR